MRVTTSPDAKHQARRTMFETLKNLYRIRTVLDELFWHMVETYNHQGRMTVQRSNTPRLKPSRGGALFIFSEEISIELFELNGEYWFQFRQGAWLHGTVTSNPALASDQVAAGKFFDQLMSELPEIV